MLPVRTYAFSDPPALAIGLEELASSGLTPRGLLFLALDPTGKAQLVVPEELDAVNRLRVGEKLGLTFPHEGRFYHYDSVHRLRTGQLLFNGDRRLAHPGDAADAAGAVSEFLRGAGARSVFFGCTPHQPGSFIASRRGTEALHDAGFVEAVPLPLRADAGLLARRILDHRLWLLDVRDRLESAVPLFASSLGNLLMLERRIVDERLVLTCEGGLIEVDVSRLPEVVERQRVELDATVAVVGRLGESAFAVTRGRPEPWGLDDIGPAVLVGANGGSLHALAEALDE